MAIAGGTWSANNETFSDAHIDGNLVTALAWPTHPEWMRKFLQVLGLKLILRWLVILCIYT